jgi:hypothetical protein
VVPGEVIRHHAQLIRRSNNSFLFAGGSKTHTDVLQVERLALGLVPPPGRTESPRHTETSFGKLHSAVDDSRSAGAG